jgi:hypothetical protein
MQNRRFKMLRNMMLKLIGAVMAILLSQSGCSVVGFGTGCLIDASKPDSLIMRGDQVLNAKIGKDVVVLLKSGETVEGKFGGVRLLPEEEYSNEYNAYCDRISDSLYLPHYGDTIDIVVASGQKLNRRFAGFDYRISSLKPTGEHAVQGFISLYHLDASIKDRIYLSEIERIIGSKGAYVERASLDALLYENELPILSFAIIHNSEYSREIALNRIDYMKMANRKNSKYHGLVLGAAIDAFAIIVGSTTDFGWGGNIYHNRSQQK